MPPSIAIIEDNEAMRASFAAAISGAADLRLAATAATFAAGKTLVEKGKFDVLLVDLGLPDGNGTELIALSRRLYPQVEVMVVTVFGDQHHVLEAIRAGATSYLLKDTAPQELVAQIRVLLDGGSPISPVIARQVLLKMAVETGKVSGPDAPPATASAPLLSQQEKRTLELAAKGLSLEEVASVMELTRHTVATYIKRCYRKLQVKSRAEAIYEARVAGLIDE